MGGEVEKLRSLARSALANWHVDAHSDMASIIEVQREQVVSRVPIASAEQQNLLAAIADRNSQGYMIGDLAREMGDSALPVIRSLLEQDLHGELGLGVSAIARPRWPPLEGCPPFASEYTCSRTGINE